ncbi:MAG TPA: hypothetical protein VJ672_02050 [Gemmatimonadaceae bacterium]|nr:hypothetical protein [Gemmatimonadaceae bacterium]
MRGNYSALCRRAFCAAVLVLATTACDDDPNAPDTGALDLEVVSPDTIGRQEPIRVVFNRPVSPQTAVDPANFVVTNLCNGLRVEGSVRLSATGDTLTFTPGTALPFLTRLGIRIQNILDLQGVSFANPVTFELITQRPPVSDVSWAFLNSPTNDFVTGINFANRNIGYISTLAGQVFRTENGGSTFGARFKEPNISFARDIHAFGPDTLFMAATQFAGGPPQGVLLRSTDAGLTFQVQGAPFPGIPTAMHMRRTGPTAFAAVIGGQATGPTVRKWTSLAGFTPSSGLPGSATQFSNVALSPNANLAVVTVRQGTAFAFGDAFRSTDGGATFTPIPLPSPTFALLGAGFVDNTTALLLGDSSTVLRANIATGAAAVPLGAAAGIPQTTVDVASGATTTYSFVRADFVPGTQVGWVVGFSTVRQPGRSDVVSGVILISRDGGNTFSRQAIAGAPDNGLSFPTALKIQALATDFAALSGLEGLVAARTADTPGTVAACQFTNP